MKSKLGIGVFASLVILVFGFSMTLYRNTNASERTELTSIGKLSDSERISRANIKLLGLAGNPQDVSTALISFDQLKDKEFIKNLIKDKSIIVKQVYFAIPVTDGPTTRGGFVPGNDIDTSFIENENHLLSSFQISIDSMKRTVGDEPQFIAETDKDKEYLEAYQASIVALRAYEERLANVQQSGVTFNGIQVEATHESLARLLNISGIRAVEVVTEKFDQKASPMLPEGTSSFTHSSLQI